MSDGSSHNGQIPADATWGADDAELASDAHRSAFWLTPVGRFITQRKPDNVFLLDDESDTDQKN